MFDRIKKKFALNNSYFKNASPKMPSNPFEVAKYVEEHGGLPYNGDLHDNWLYECYVEYQKRHGVVNSQFFTPQKTAKRMAELVLEHSAYTDRIIEPCCGFGMITKELINEGFVDNLLVFDCDSDLLDLFRVNCPDFNNYYKADFTQEAKIFDKYDIVVANPPYEGKILTEFLDWCLNTVCCDRAILLLPSGFLDKTRPARLARILNGFSIIHREPMDETFARTNTNAEIVVLKRIC